MKALSLARKDVSSHFYSPLAVVIFVFFFLLTGVLFAMLVTSYSRVSAEVVAGKYQNLEGLHMTHFIFGSFFLNLGIVMLFLIPLVTMRCFSEERSQQTLELLFTYPFSDSDIVWGKFLGLVWFMVLLLAPTLVYIFLFQLLGGFVDWGPMISGYLGLFLLTCSFLSLGLYISTLTANQVISALVTFGCLLALWGLEWVANITDGAWTAYVRQFSPFSHYREFTYGIIDLHHTAYFIFFCLYFLFLALRSIETRNWKG